MLANSGDRSDAEAAPGESRDGLRGDSMGFFGLFGHIGHRIIDLPLILIPLLIGFISLAAAEGNRLARRLMIVLIAIVVGFAVCQYVFYGTLPRSPIIIFDQGYDSDR